MSEIKWLDHGVMPTNDLGRAILFYRDVLGAEIERLDQITTEVLTGSRGMMRCFMKLGPSRFGLFLQHEQLPPPDGLTGSPCYEWEVRQADLPHVVQSLEQHSVEYEGPVDGPPGYPIAKQVFFNDPDGNHVAVCALA